MSASQRAAPIFNVECPTCQSTRAILAYDHPWCYFCPSCRHVWNISLTPTNSDSVWRSPANAASLPDIRRAQPTLAYRALVEARTGGDRRQPDTDRRLAYRRRIDRRHMD